MTNKLAKNTGFFGLSFFLCTACSSDNKDLIHYINGIKSRPGAPIESIPKFAALALFNFAENDNSRNPFKLIEVKKQDQHAPDQKRLKQPLEAFPLDGLKFVGTLKQGKQLWALINDPEKKVVPVKVGHYMGLNFGRIISIKSDEISLEERTKNSGRWEKKMTTIHLDTGK